MSEKSGAESSPSSSRIQSVERAIGLMESIADGPEQGSTLAEAADACGINRATAWRLLATLEDRHYVEKDPYSSRYTIGFAVNRLARSAGVDHLINRCHPILKRLCEETGETASLAVPRELGLMYVDEVVPPSLMTVRWIGRRVSLHATSAGKAMLAWLPESDTRAVLAAPLTGHTESTHTRMDELEADLAEIRTVGYSVAAGELEHGVCGVSAAICAPRRNPIGVISIWGPQERIPDERFSELGALVTAAVREAVGGAGD
ncbi:DNA-binding transcriptional regulator, IclR family [Brevibacterium siliguriense]|uniref:DNA-binding transcriptional regulator, IclR family n=1 Tax=Brevibacterium siliguriense TaxID=1136497 RepID=A0A1H1QER6_9MICO|nr:IclR family transcriptional regulator [Brevibacterium siliguriense]SDS21950.1 DNA-binding transcriptional regulator, IclR family [Brevibacterium siliguriense]